MHVMGVIKMGCEGCCGCEHLSEEEWKEQKKKEEEQSKED